MFDHVTVRVSDRDASERFYDLALPTLGIEKSHTDEHYAEWSDFSLTAGDKATSGLHIGFVAPSREHSDEFWRVGVDAGYRDDGAPGPRPQYGGDYYGSFLLDPDGNSAEAVHHGTVTAGETIDHLWIRVADVAASQAFYELVAELVGFRSEGVREDPHRARFAGESGSFSVVEGGTTQPFHLAFPAGDNAAVDAFHWTLVEAGYRDNGAPGERPIYHESYYGAYVLDPDGHNVELVNHNR